MHRTRIRIARIAAASALTLTFAAAAGSAAAPAGDSSPAEAEQPAVLILATGEDDATPDGDDRPGGVQAVEDGASTNGKANDSITFDPGAADDDSTIDGQTIPN